MLISHLKKFIYLKSVRTASTSVEIYFEKYCMPETEWRLIPSQLMLITPDGIIGQRGEVPPDTPWYSHQSAIEIKQKIGKDIWDSYFKFGTVRNPFDKAVSLFYMSKSDSNKPILDLENEKTEFEKWLVDGNYHSDFYIYSIDNACCFDAYVRYESIYPDLQQICDKIKVPFVPRLVKAHSHSRPKEFNALTLFTDVGKQVINDICKLELAQFGYSFPTTTFKVE
jgi:hypothetical protein